MFPTSSLYFLDNLTLYIFGQLEARFIFSAYVERYFRLKGNLLFYFKNESSVPVSSSFRLN